jgi:hypothetical protein
MNFIDALGYLYHNRTSDEEFTDPFFLYCRMSDLCSSSYEDKRKVLLFYQVNKKLDMVRSILNKDETVSSRHKEVADLLSDNSFYKLLESVKCVIFPDYKREEKPKPQPQKKAVVQAVITKTEETQEEEARTPLTSSYVGGGDTDVIIGLSIMGGVLLAIVLFIVFACVFNWSWMVWQWLIGIVGGVLLSAILVGIVAWFEEECLADYYVFGTFVLGICVLLNIILLLIFRDNYKVIFGWFSGFELIIGAILTFVTCDDCEDGWVWLKLLR